MSGKLKSLVSNHKWPLLLVLIAVVSHLQWFNPWSLLQSGDWQFRFDEHVKQLWEQWGTWIAFQDMGSPNIQAFAFPLRGLLWSGLAMLGLSYDMITKLTLFIPIALGGFLVPYYVAARIVRDKFIGFVVALFYGTTIYFLIMETRHLLIAMVYVLMPLFFYLLYKIHRDNKMRDWIIAALLASIGIFYELRIMYIVIAVLLAYIAYNMFFRQIKNLKSYFKPFLVFCGVMLLINLFWIIPTALGAGSAISETADRGLFGDALFHLDQSFTIFRWSWTGGYEDRSFIVQPIQWYLWLAPIIAFGALTLKTRYKKQILFFAIIAVAGLILTKQSAQPFSDLYLWLYEHVPGFNVFREASKFYVVTAFAYWGLLLYGLKTLKESNADIYRLAFKLCAVALIAVALVNLKPLITREIGAVFVSGKVPADYLVLKDFLRAQDDYSRTLWVPQMSTWGYYDAHHPKMGSLTFNNKEWDYAKIDSKPLPASEEFALAPLKVDLSNYLLDSSSIKYVILPIQRSFNYDDQYLPYGGENNPHIRKYYEDELNKLPFLKQIDIGTKQLLVYENQNYVPYIASPERVYAVDSLQNIPAKYDYITATKGQDFNFVNAETKTPVPSTALRDIFDNLSAKDLGNGITQNLTVNKGESLFTNVNAPSLSYRVINGTLSIMKTVNQPPTLDTATRSVRINAQSAPEVMSTTKLASGKQYDIQAGQTSFAVDTSGATKTIGTIKAGTVLEINERTAPNLLSNPSFEEGEWAEKADCPKTGHKPIVSPQTIADTTGRKGNILTMPVDKFAVCTSHEAVPVQAGGSYRLSFDYRVEKGQRAAYEVAFNDDGKTVRKAFLPAINKDWRTFSGLVTVPEGATNLTLTLFAYPDDRRMTPVTVYYDEFSLVQTRSVGTAKVPGQNAPAPVALQQGSYKLTYQLPAYNAKNLIVNASFEQGTWQKDVRDCNQYDTKAELAMRTTTAAKSDGNNALELSANGHIACTSTPPATIDENSLYLFQFDYQSPNKAPAGYYIAFNDPARTVVKSKIPVKDKQWHTWKERIRTPVGATGFTLTLYSYGEEPRISRAVNHYDAFAMTKIPDLTNAYYLMADSLTPATPPGRVTFTVATSTHKEVSVKGASGPFYLAMNEAYHANWQLAGNGIIVKEHFKLNNLTNGWYVDPAQLCRNQSNACTKNSDGTYDMTMAVTFKTQKYLLVGSVISGLAVIGCIVYLVRSKRVAATKARMKQKQGRVYKYVGLP